MYNTTRQSHLTMITIVVLHGVSMSWRVMAALFENERSCVRCLGDRHGACLAWMPADWEAAQDRMACSFPPSDSGGRSQLVSGACP